MSLPQRLSLDVHKRLKIAPVEAVAQLRAAHFQMDQVVLLSNQEVVLDQVSGNSLELNIEINAQDAQSVRLDVLRSPDGQERTSVCFYNHKRNSNVSAAYTKPEIVLDGTFSSTLPDVSPRSPERAIIDAPAGKTLKLRIFIDRSVVEVFADEQQYLAMRVYPGRADSVGISLTARGGTAVVKRMDVWQMRSIWD